MKERLASTGTFCPQQGCEHYAKVGADNIIKYGRTRRGVQQGSDRWVVGLRGPQRAKGGYEESAHAGELRWRCTLIESESRLRVARGLAKSETEASIAKRLSSSRSGEDIGAFGHHWFRMGGVDMPRSDG